MPPLKVRDNVDVSEAIELYLSLNAYILLCVEGLGNVNVEEKKGNK